MSSEKTAEGSPVGEILCVWCGVVCKGPFATLQGLSLHKNWLGLMLT